MMSKILKNNSFLIGAGATATGLSLLALYLISKRYFLSLEKDSKRNQTRNARENLKTKFLKKTEADSRRFLLSNNVVYNLSLFVPKGKIYCGKVDIEFFLTRKRSGISVSRIYMEF